jgi:hypothetical protein
VCERERERERERETRRRRRRRRRSSAAQRTTQVLQLVLEPIVYVLSHEHAVEVDVGQHGVQEHL